MKKKLIFVSLLLIPFLNFCLTKEEVIKKINAYAVQIIDKDLGALKNNARIYNFDPMLFSIRKYINEGIQQASEEPVIEYSKKLLDFLTTFIDNSKNPLGPDLNKANEIIDKLQYADINTDNLDKQEILEHLRKAIVEISNHVFSLNIAAVDSEKYMILKDDIKNLKNDINEFEDFFNKNRLNILSEEFLYEAESNWFEIKAKTKAVIDDSKSDQLPQYLVNIEKLGNELFEILKTTSDEIASKEGKSETKESLIPNLYRDLSNVSASLERNLNELKKLKILSLSKVDAQNILINLADKLSSIIKIINSVDFLKSEKRETQQISYDQVFNDLTNYLIKLRKIATSALTLKVASKKDKNSALDVIKSLQKTSSTIFTHLTFYILHNQKHLEEIVKRINLLNHKLLNNIEKHHNFYIVKAKKIFMKDRFKQNFEERKKIIEELNKLIKDLKELKSADREETKIINLFVLTSNGLLDVSNEFNKNLETI